MQIRPPVRNLGLESDRDACLVSVEESVMGLTRTSQSTCATDLGTAATATTYATLNDPGFGVAGMLLIVLASLLHHARTQVQAYTTLRH